MTSPAPTRRPKGPFGRSAPYRGVFSEFIRGLSWVYLKATGWRVGSDWPVEVPKSVIVAAPHTSNWDGLTMVAVAGWYRVKLNWMGKAALVRGPLGWLVNRYIEAVIGTRFDPIAPRATLAQARCPVLLLHGRQDSTVPLADARALMLRRGAARATLLELDGGHEGFADPAQAEQAVLDFLRRTT